MIQSRNHAGANDRSAVLELWLAASVPGLDDPWPSLDLIAAELDAQAGGSERARLWQDSRGQLLAAALLLDECILVWRTRPGADDDSLELEILAWGRLATERLALAAGVEQALYVPARSDDPRLAALLTRTGFRRDQWRTLRMGRSLKGPFPSPQAPPGVVVRPVMGEADLAAAVALHRSLFAVGEKTARERAALMRAPGYRPGMDLVAFSADGSLAGYALGVCCVYGRERSAQAPGWIEFVGVAPGQRGRGLGHALTIQLLRAMRAEGLDVALLTTGEANLAARRLFTSCGFQVRHTIEWFVRELASP